MGRKRDLGAVKTDTRHLQSHLGRLCPPGQRLPLGREVTCWSQVLCSHRSLLGPLGILQPTRRSLSWSLGSRASAALVLS